MVSIAGVTFLVGWWGGVNSHNRIKPNINCGCIELYWGCGWGFDNIAIYDLPTYLTVVKTGWGWFLEGVWRVSEVCLQDVRKGLECVWRLNQNFWDYQLYFGQKNSFEHKIILTLNFPDTKFFRLWILPINNFLNQDILRPKIFLAKYFSPKHKFYYAKSFWW